jgi:hypothetical protein
VQAAPKGEPPVRGGGGSSAEHGPTGVVNVHVKSEARELPKVSAAPVLMAAVKVEFAARATEGVKVAISVAAT